MGSSALVLNCTVQGDDAGHTRNSSNTSTKSQASAGYGSQSSQLGGGGAHSRQSSEDSSHARNPSAGSADTGIGFGSMEKDKRRKKLDGGRVDAEDVINELMEDIQIENMAVQEGNVPITLTLAVRSKILNFVGSSDSEF